LALGFSYILGSDELTIVVNTADDDRFYGLHVSPDLDTVMYTLAGVSNAEMGWGLVSESFRTLERLKEYGVDAWFNLGDLDLATHLYRTKMLDEGKTLSEVCQRLAKSLGVEHKILPVTDSSIKTVLETQDGVMSFQEYFVKNQCEPVVKSIDFEGASNCTVTPEVRQAVMNMDLLVFCPSNPFVSLAPILSVPGFKQLIESFSGRSIGVSPIAAGPLIASPPTMGLTPIDLPENDSINCLNPGTDRIGARLTKGFEGQNTNKSIFITACLTSGVTVQFEDPSKSIDLTTGSH
jgi:LPPG:FO 2-phospho-L-lactate transferase